MANVKASSRSLKIMLYVPCKAIIKIIQSCAFLNFKYMHAVLKHIIYRKHLQIQFLFKKSLKKYDFILYTTLVAI